MCDAIERTHGRREPKCLRGPEYLRAHRSKLTHFDENMGEDFLDVLQRQRFKSKIVTNFCVSKCVTFFFIFSLRWKCGIATEFPQPGVVKIHKAAFQQFRRKP